MYYIPKNQANNSYIPPGTSGKEGTVGRVLDYMDACLEAATEEANDYRRIDSKKLNNAVNSYLPNKNGLGKFLGVPVSQIDKWQEDYPEFADVIEFMHTVSTDTIISQSLVGNFKEGLSKKLLEQNGVISPDNTSKDQEALNEGSKTTNYYYVYPGDKAELDTVKTQEDQEVQNTMQILKSLKDE